MKAWFRSLAGGTSLVTAAVAVLAVLVTGLVAFPLIRSAAIDQAKVQLSRQADAFAALPAASRALDLRERRLLGPDDFALSAISADGAVAGAAANFISTADVQKILAGQEISKKLTHDGAQFLLEARALKRGGGIVLSRPLVDVNAASAQLLQRTLLALAVGLLIAVAAGTMLARRLSRPLVRTAAAARRIASGERTVHLVPSGATEVRAVGDAVNALDHALLASEGRQREFLLSISHEIRTPLTAMRGYAEAMVDGLVPPGDMPRIGQTLAAETERLDGFVKDLLALARLEAEDFSVDVREVDVGSLLHEVEAAWRGVAGRADVRLALELPPGGGEPLLAATDRDRLRQIIDGLVGNALRVTPAGRPLLLRARWEHSQAMAGPSAFAPAHAGAPDVVAVDIQDSGPGLTSQDAADAFERGVLFRRYAGQRAVGSGLGLSIAARLALRLGLRLTVEPAAPDAEGACFCIRLPRSQGRP